MTRGYLALALLCGVAGLQPSLAQPGPPLASREMLRADFAAKTGGGIVYFGINSAQIGVPAKAALAAQALWLRQHPEARVRIEGHGDPDDTRDHALAMGAQRAGEVRNYLILLGVPPDQLGAMSWGKERPGPGRAVTTLVP